MNSIIRRLILALALSAGLAPAFAQVPPPVPALPDTERRTTYSISGTTCACAINMALYGDGTDYQNWIEVFINGIRANFNDATFGWTVTSPSGALSGLARPITNAVLTFNSVQTGTIQIVGARRPRRTSQFNEGAGVPTRSFNVVLSDLTAQNREVWDKINDVTGRSVRTPPGETLNLLPVLANRQNMGACFDSGGNLNSCVSIPSSTFVAGNGITLSGVGPTTITNNIVAGSGITLTGTNPITITVAAVPPSSITGTITPQARITLASGTPVMATSQTNVATVFVTPFGGNLIPLYDGSNMLQTPFAEVSQAISDATKSPAALGAGKITDIFCWVDTGPVNRCTRGFEWTNDTTPCANCGLTLVNGIYLNTTSITNGPAAQRGTWMGMVRSNAGGTGVNFTYGSIGAGGVAGDFSVFNAYNQVPLYTTVQDNTNSWTYNVSDVWRAPNGNATMRVSILRRFASSQFEAKYSGIVGAGAGATAIAGVGLNSTTSVCGQNSGTTVAGSASLPAAICTGVLPVGYSFVSAVEYNDTTTASTWRGLVPGATPLQSGFHFNTWQ